jgi:outer membrane receptor for ferrienterochelin and colicin
MRNNISKTFKRSIAAIAVTTVLGMTSASADDLVGRINGSSTAGVTVKAVNVDTGTQRTVSIDEDGSYRLAKMPSGNYKITVIQNGVVIAEDNARASLGRNTVTNFDVAATDNTEVIQVVGSSIATIDVSSSDSGLIVGEFEIDRMPIARNLTAVALLAPGVVQGDSTFGNQASFGGSSVAENVCYINGMEVTNTRNGLGCGELPFEFYKEFQVKTGGYSAKYGRATGGAMNATAKSGTNEWEFAATATFTPDSWRSDNEKKSRANGNTGVVYRDSSINEKDSKEYTLSVGGPIIEDELFFYAIVNPKDTSQTYGYQPSFWDGYLSDNQVRERESQDDVFWGATIDWDISENHRLSYFGYSNKSEAEEAIYGWDDINKGAAGVGALIGTNIRKRGGETHSIKYTGYITDDLIVTAMAGKIETEYETSPTETICPTIADARTPASANPAVGCGQGGSFGDNNDTNTQYAIDVEYAIGDHTITAGYEFQKRETTRVSKPSGGHNYTYYTLAAGGEIQGDNGVLFSNDSGASQDYVRDRIFSGGGGFSSDIAAYFIEDIWQASDDITVKIGLRVDDFENVGVTGNVLTSFTTDAAPRLGITWDPTGSGESKIFATAGQYYLPIANNTIFRAASGVDDRTTHYTFSGVNPADGVPTGSTPVNGTEANSQVVNSTPQPPTKATFQADEAEPFSKIEYIIGYEGMLSDEYSILVKGTYRYVDTALDDYCGAYANGYCMMLNPGSDSSVYLDADSDGIADNDTLTTFENSSTIQLPEGVNKYLGLETSVKYQGENLNWTTSWTWSHSYGNFEGAVKSDNGQADAGLTTDFDFPALMDGADGNLPNDRRHVVKFFGSYEVTEDLVVGWNSTLASGRPRGVQGGSYWTSDSDLYGSYGDTYYVTQDDGSITYHPRGSNGTTSWTFTLDLSANYIFEINDIEMKASLDIFNVLDNSQVTSIVDNYEGIGWAAGERNQFYGAAKTWQTPRYATLGLEVRF